MAGHPAAPAADYSGRFTVALRGRAGKRHGSRSRSRAAFTLVELMAAIGLMVLLTAGAAMVFHREGNAGVALKAARRELGSALRLAQSAAHARQEPVRLCVLSEPAPGEPMGAVWRRWWLMRREGTAWVRMRDAGDLPAGTCVVPTERSALQVRPGITWPDHLLSQLDGPASGDDGAMYYVECRSDGTPSAGPRRLVVAAANEAPGQASRLHDPAAVRVLQISADGRIEEVAP